METSTSGKGQKEQPVLALCPIRQGMRRGHADRTAEKIGIIPALVPQMALQKYDKDIERKRNLIKVLCVKIIRYDIYYLEL
jgi:hypothetical protein